MKISEIMNENCIVVGLKAQSKRQLLQELAQKAAEITHISERTIFDSLLERENLGSTGFGGGTALPHARIAEAQKVCGIAPVKPGFKEFSVMPQMGPLVQAETSLLSVNGRISIALNRSGKDLKIRLNVPPNTQALLPIKADVRQVSLNGDVIYKNKQFCFGKRYKIDSLNGHSVRLPEGEWRITILY